jgi:hypothetical protein
MDALENFDKISFASSEAKINFQENNYDNGSDMSKISPLSKLSTSSLR